MSKTAKRLQYQRMLQDAKRGAFDTILIPMQQTCLLRQVRSEDVRQPLHAKRAYLVCTAHCGMPTVRVEQVDKAAKYGLLLESATEVASACLDMENGAFLLAWASELIRDLATAGYVQSATLTVQKLCETVDTEAQWIGYGEMRKEEKQAWFRLFAEALMDCMKVANTTRSSL